MKEKPFTVFVIYNKNIGFERLSTLRHKTPDLEGWCYSVVGDLVDELEAIVSIDGRLSKYPSAIGRFSGNELFCAQLQFITPNQGIVKTTNPKTKEIIHARYSESNVIYDLGVIAYKRDFDEVGIRDTFWHRGA